MIMKSNGNKDVVRAALVSANESFAKAVHELVDATRGQVEVGLETDATPDTLLREPTTPIHDYHPHILFLDLGSSPDDGIRLAGLLVRKHPGLGIVASGHELTQAQLVEAMRAGVSEVVGRRPTRDELDAGLNRVLHRIGMTGEAAGVRGAGKVLAFFSAKGGTGCTTVAMNVGVQLHRLTGKKTLLVDLDLELGEIASFMGLRPRFHLVDLLRNFHRMDEDLLPSYIDQHESGAHVLSAPFEPETGEAIDADQIGAVISFLKRQYDYVVIDTSKSLAPPALAAMKPADQLYLVANLDLCSLRNFKRCTPILKALGGQAADRMRLVVNRYTKNSLVSLAEMESTVGLPTYARLPNDFHSVIASLSTGKPLVLESNSRYTKSIKEFAARIAGHSGKEGKERSVLGRLLSVGSGSSKAASWEAYNHA
jgi:pilus assembly protein CpaE